MDLAELRELRPRWTVEQTRDGIRCQYGAWRFLAADPDDAEDEIERRVGPPGKPRPPRTDHAHARDTALSGMPRPGTFGALIADLRDGERI